MDALLDKRLDYVQEIMQRALVDDDICKEHNICKHEYVSPLQHHKCSLVLHSMVIHRTVSDFYSIFPKFTERNIYLKKVVILRVSPAESHASQYAHVFDLSPCDLLSHFERMSQVFKKFDADKYNGNLRQSLDDNEEYQRYLYSHRYIDNLVKSEQKTDDNCPDFACIKTVPSNLYMYVCYKHRMIILPKYYEYDSATQLYCDLDKKVFNAFCRSHYHLFDLQTLKTYLDPIIVKKYFKSVLDTIYRIYAFAQFKQKHSFSNVARLSKSEGYQPSRIWQNYLFNIHPTMIYIHNHVNWSSFVQLFMQCVDINTCDGNASKSFDECDLFELRYFTDHELSFPEQHVNISIDINVCAAGYVGGGGQGSTDNTQYLAPEFFASFDAQRAQKQPESKEQQSSSSSSSRSPQKFRTTITSFSPPSASMSGNNLTKQSNLTTGAHLASFLNHRTEPLAAIEPKQSVTDQDESMSHEDEAIIIDADEYHAMEPLDELELDADVDAEDEDEDDDEQAHAQLTLDTLSPGFQDVVSVPLKDSKGRYKKKKRRLVRKQQAAVLKRRTDIDYLSDFWNLGSNIFSVGVMLFILLNGYGPFETAEYSDRWYKEIVKEKFHRFWKLHRASPINAIPMPSAPASFTLSTMNVLSPRSILQYEQMTSGNSKITMRHTINANMSASTGHGKGKGKLVAMVAPYAFASVHSSRNVMNNKDNTDLFSDDEDNMLTPSSADAYAKKTGTPLSSLTRMVPARTQRTVSANYVFRDGAETDVDNGQKQKKSKKNKAVYDYRSIQGLVNDLLRYDATVRLQAFFAFQHNDLDFNNNLQPLYHKYWFLDIAFNGDDGDFTDHESMFKFEDIQTKEAPTNHDGDTFAQKLYKLRHDKQEAHRKKSKTQGGHDNDDIRCICWIMDAKQSDPPFFPRPHLEGLYAELYTTKRWRDFLHEFYHIVLIECKGEVIKSYSEHYKRLICKITIANNNNSGSNKEQQKRKSISFEIVIWRSSKWQHLNTADDVIYMVQWRRLFGNCLDYMRVINHVIHEKCHKLFYLPVNVRRAMKPAKNDK
eukprot:CAMPEP_0202691942 /NCGR_PEP_ID=MMETSP1385-20130828/6485_1 /ASSEMBLY_ACC=CAM_ASM_000861 /TAXON_ID=933848 /ORGANISM="Elphidium margaritaceum" /LENGTH=1050 /DNA_ID=CAMNT_0049347407 /DNA_START=23 /DNA_END=3175 /DNA_ORIENTATION=+